jgi:predicted DsbA family dithiol-disulfide isomerase|tara:strand:+ start:1151 stop:2338 length:1188 start_codon:yes stop_codon:yes gene_type:complete
MKTISSFFFKKMKKHTKTFFFISIVFGGLLTFAMQQRVLQIAQNNYKGFDVCKTFFGNSCDGSLASAFSAELGFSLASIALVYFGIIGLLLVLDKPILNGFALLISAFGAGSSLMLSILIMATPLSCSGCLVLHGIIILSFLLVWQITMNGIRDKDLKVKTKTRRLLGILGIILIVTSGFLSQMFLIGGSEGIEHLSSLEGDFTKYRNETSVEFDWGNEAHILGSVNAPIRLVMVSSFQCPGCQTMSSTVKKLKSQYGDDIVINYVHFPLSEQCNSSLQFDMQPQSCASALAAIAAAKQGKFWEYHDKIFNSKLSLTETELIEFARGLNLDMQLWEADRVSEASYRKLQEDISTGNSLEVNSTPTIYVNGKKTPRIDEAFLRYIFHEILLGAKEN